jgi:hypothetical protein
MDLGGKVKAPMRRTTSSGQRDGGAITIPYADLAAADTKPFANDITNAPERPQQSATRPPFGQQSQHSETSENDCTSEHQALHCASFW